MGDGREYLRMPVKREDGGTLATFMECPGDPKEAIPKPGIVLKFIRGGGRDDYGTPQFQVAMTLRDLLELAAVAKAFREMVMERRRAEAERDGALDFGAGS